MFNARHVSLSSGQSYEFPVILERKDYANYGIFDLSGPLSLCFMADGQTIVCNQWNLRTIQLDYRRRSGHKSRSFERLVLDKDIVYSDCTFIHQDDYEYAHIPRIIGEGLNQFVWSCDQGTFITHDANIVSLIEKDVRGGRTQKVVPRNAIHVRTPVLESFKAQAVQRHIGG
jgi:hypothetical protein